MRTRTIVLVVALAFVCLFAGNLIGSSEEEVPEKKSPPPTVERLLRRIEILEARVALLDTRLKVLDMRSQLQALPVVESHGAYTQDGSLPKGWTRKEFNGHYYYVVPLSSADRGRPPTPPAR
jgi:hypothetical protein